MVLRLRSRLLPGFYLLIAGIVLGACGTGTPAGQAPQASPVSESEERLFRLDNDTLRELTEGEWSSVLEAPTGAFLFDAAVSPDGRDIALAVQLEPKQVGSTLDFGIDLMLSLDGGPLRIIAEHARIGETMSRPIWLPGDGQVLFAVLGRDETGAADIRLERVHISTGVRERLIEDALEPAISRDLSTLAYVRYGELGEEVITLWDLATGATRDLLPPDQVMSNVANLAWGPDGQRIAFAAADPVPRLPGAMRLGASVTHPTLRDIWLVNIDGTGLRRITELADASLSLAWSRDNRQIYALGDTGFWRVDTETGDIESIGEPNRAGRVQTLFP